MKQKWIIMSQNNLKNCPLCGKNDLMVYIEFIPLVGGDSKNLGVVECLTDNCPMIIRASTEAEAIQKWQNRPIEDELSEDLDIAIDALKSIEGKAYPNGVPLSVEAHDALVKIGKSKAE